MSQVYVVLTVHSGARAPDEISRLVGIQPDYAWLKGEPRSEGGIVAKDNGWVLQSGLDSEEPFDVQLNILLGRVSVRAKEFHTLSEEDSIQLFCAIYSDAPAAPPCVLSREQVETIAALGAAFELNYYDLSE